MNIYQGPTQEVPSSWLSHLIANTNVLQWFRFTNHSMIDATTYGALMSQMPEAAYGLLAQLTSNNYQWSFEWARPKPMVWVMELNQMNNFESQLTTINKKLDRLRVNSIQSNVVYETCARDHTMAKCSLGESLNLEQAANVGNHNQQNNSNSNTYKSSWRNHANFLWSNN